MTARRDTWIERVVSGYVYPPVLGESVLGGLCHPSPPSDEECRASDNAECDDPDNGDLGYIQLSISSHCRVHYYDQCDLIVRWSAVGGIDGFQLGVGGNGIGSRWKVRGLQRIVE